MSCALAVPLLASELQRAMSDKDFRENAPLDALRDQQGHLESRIRDIESALHNAVLVERGGEPKSEVATGATVHLRNLKSGALLKYTVVSPREVNAAEGKISIDSPMGRAHRHPAGGRRGGGDRAGRIAPLPHRKDRGIDSADRSGAAALAFFRNM